MHVDHFDGKSVARRSMAWLTAASHDAHDKRMQCRDYPAHEAMWLAKAQKYNAEIERRERRGSK